MHIRRALIGVCLVAGTAAASAAFAHGGVAVQIGVVPPPAPVVAYVPAPRYGYVWVPGYRVWHRDHYVWTRGHWVRHKHRHKHGHYRHYDRYAYRY
jgi:hypothetical protein